MPGWDNRHTAATPTPSARTAEPTNTARNGTLACASALIPRMAASASAGWARSSPVITKVEKAKKMPPTTAVVTAAAAVAIR
ncbi:hypothetical protein JCM12141A_21520 [Mycolicibacterium hodleri]